MALDEIKKQPPKNRLILSICVGAVLGLVPFASAMMMVRFSYQNPISHFLYFLYGVGLPGSIIEGLVRIMPHGGGTLLEFLSIVLLFNFAFYSTVTYCVLAVIGKLDTAKS